MRLIDADSIRGCAKYIKTNEKFEPYIMIDDLSKLIDEQPTAYSVDNVVEELEKSKDKGSVTKTERLITKACVDKAIEIVKHGGVSGDVCECRIADKVVYASCNNKQIASAFCWLNECGDYKYCPYCGKRIKVIGD